MMQTLEIEVDSFGYQAKDCLMILKKNHPASNQLTLG